MAATSLAAGGTTCVIFVALSSHHEFAAQRMPLQRRFIDCNAKTRPTGRHDMPVDELEVAVADQHIRPRDPKAENEFRCRHHPLARRAGIEMRARGSLELRKCR